MLKNYSGWFILYVKFRHERKVDSILKELELDSFLPTISTIRQWADRKKKVIKPLFPCYVFVNIHSNTEFFKALNIYGVIKYVRFGEDFAKIRHDEINRIKYFLNLEGISEIETTGYVPFKGEKMIINCGPLYGLECEVVRMNCVNKVFVRIDSLKKNITAIVPSNFLLRKLT